MRIPASVTLLLLFAGPVSAQDSDEVFRSANTLYQEQRYDEARELYESIVANGLESSALYLNLGNTYIRLGHTGKAVLNYERGLRLDPDDEDLQHNMTIAGLMTIDKIEPVPRLFIWDFWDDVKAAFSFDGILWTTWSVYVLFFAALSTVVVAGSYTLRRAGLFGALGSGLLFLLLLLVGIGRYSDLSRSDLAILMPEIISVKNSPDVRDTDAFVLHRGTKVQITDALEGWVKIRLADGKVGWVTAESLEVI